MVVVQENLAVAEETGPVMSRQLLPASQFTIQALTDAYNQTRVDYLVPMPLNAARLQAYIDLYDIDMDGSVVAVLGDQILGINMLGLRSNRSWITRLGVLPVKRRMGTGEAMSRHLLANSDAMGIEHNVIEVIQNNVPAHNLFLKLDFYETRELLILRRAPNGEMPVPDGEKEWLSKDQAIARLEAYPGPLAWTNMVETFVNAPDVIGLCCALPDGDWGWMIFRKQKFYLTHFVLHTEQGDPAAVARTLLTHVHREFAHLDTHTENVASDDPHLPAFWELGYFEAFRRIEMYRER